MPVTDASAVKFSDQVARVSADLMAQAYYRSVAAIERWTALGGGQAALDLMVADLRACADAIKAAYLFAYSAEVYWFLGVNSAFSSNDTTPVYDNGSFTAQDTNRPLATTAKVNAVLSRVVEFQNWLLSATQSFTDSARGSRAALNTVFQCTSSGVATMAVSDAGNLINRCGELKANYEASTNANLNSLLAFAVNPNP